MSVQEDKTGKSKQGENKDRCVSCCHHTPKKTGESGGICRETCSAASRSQID